MAEKDIVEKTLEAYNDVFSDIVNVLLFGGRQVVKEDELTDESPLSQYKAAGTLHEQERDVAKFWRNGSIRICLYGLENQTAVDNDIPLRVISYDGASYRAQLLDDKVGQKKQRYPVVTLVLYFGMRHWKKPRSLFDRLNIPKEIKPFVSDYKVNIFEIAWLESETVRLFKSDFRIVADYFVQMRTNKEYVPSAETIRHVNETLQLLSVLTNDNRFELAQQPAAQKGGTTMCDVLDKVERKGFSTGKKDVVTVLAQLQSEGRNDDLLRAIHDEQYLDSLLAGIKH